MEITNPNLLYPGNSSTLNCKFKQKLKSIFNRCRSDKIEASPSDPVGGVDVGFRKMRETMNYIGSLEMEEPLYSDEVKKRFDWCKIEKGATFDILSMLSEGYYNSNHLIRIINGEIQCDEVVQVDCLKGKFILVCCVFAPYLLNGNFTSMIHTLSLLSHELSLRDDVEMVLVIKVRLHWPGYETVVRQFVSAFSCLAVPFDHLSRIDSICMRLNMGVLPTAVLVDPCQLVIQDNLAPVLQVGVDAFPYTDTNIRSHLIFSKKMKSLEQILASNIPALPYRIFHGKHEVASVSELGQKLVGLYLFITGHDMPLLMNAYTQCQALGLEFEVVVFCMPGDIISAPKELEHVMTRVLEEKKLPWWVFPLNTTVLRRLQARTCSDIEDRLFIVLPDGRLMESHGELVLHHFGIDTYPFTRESVVMKALYKLSQLTLESSLVGGLLYQGCGQASVADLRGRNVILCLDWIKNRQGLDALLIKYYSHLKAMDPHMEVVFACLDTDLPDIAKWATFYMPWLVYHRDPSKSKSEFVADDLFVCGLETKKMVAFGKDGRISSICAQRHLLSHGPAAFPFYGNLVEEICEELKVKDCQIMDDMAWSERFLI